MTRNEAIFELIKYRRRLEEDSTIDVEPFDMAIEALEQPTADVPQWIPCSERLPYSQEDVLCDDDGRVTIGYYTDEEVGWHDKHSYKIYPTAWMPLPKPWKGERG